MNPLAPLLSLCAVHARSTRAVREILGGSVKSVNGASGVKGAGGFNEAPLFASNGPIGDLVFRFCRLLVRLFVVGWLRVKSEGRERLAREGPFIIAPVHRSHIDGPLVGTLTHRRLRYLGKESLFRPAIVGWFMKSFGSFPVKRGTADLGAMKAAKRLLDDGGVVLVFPEGGRQDVGDVGEVFDGAAWLAAKAKVPVVPVGISGTGEALPRGAKFPRRTRAAVVVGEVMEMPTAADGGAADRDDMRAWSGRLKANLQQCQQRAIAMAQG